MQTKAAASDRTPTLKMYFVPNCAMTIPAALAPIVVPKLTEVRKSPLAKSGALGAADMIQY